MKRFGGLSPDSHQSFEGLSSGQAQSGSEALSNLGSIDDAVQWMGDKARLDSSSGKEARNGYHKLDVCTKRCDHFKCDRYLVMCNPPYRKGIVT